ncbi:MAG: DUF3540 domain-containing protein [Myxococcales bacterium]|nr:DUF3540 domain-containing protein [Myxococcales bacterium]
MTNAARDEKCNERTAVTAGSAAIAGSASERRSERPAVIAGTPSGAFARVEEDRIDLCDTRGRLVLRYDGRTGELVLSADDLRLTARGKIVVEGQSLELRAARITAESHETEWRTQRWEVTAGLMIERAANVLRSASELYEQRATHARTLVSETLELLAGRATLSSRDDTRIDGKRVRLG